MTIRFFIGAEKKQLAHIYVSLSLGRRQRFICKTGFLVDTDRWSNDTETIKQRKLTKEDQRLIDSLASLRRYLDTEVRFNAIGNKSKEWLQSLVNKFHGVSSENDFNGFIQSLIDRMKSGEMKNEKGINYSIGTARAFEGFKGAISRYQGIYTDEEREAFLKANKLLRPLSFLSFEQINIDFYHDFIRYLTEDGYKTNTIGRFTKELNRVMTVALRERKHNNREYERFNVLTEDSHAIYLTPVEIEKIYNYKCDDPRQKLARDCFIVLCETGLRISDYKKISIGIKGRFIEIYQTKTSRLVVIPLTKRMSEILENYGGKLPYIHENYVNEYIKTIAFRCGITERIAWVTQSKGLKVEMSAEKWTLVTCHTGRRSFATNAKDAGIDLKDISMLLGHKSVRTTENYLRTTVYDTARKVADHEFFTRLRVAN